MEKFDAKADEGIFVGYSTVGSAFRVFNRRTLVVEESVHVSFDESLPTNSKTLEEEEVVPNIGNLEIDLLELSDSSLGVKTLFGSRCKARGFLLEIDYHFVLCSCSIYKKTIVKKLVL